MPFRFRKSIKLGKGFKLNLSKSGISTTIGGKGLSLNLGKRGTRLTTGIPGSGLSYSTQVTPSSSATQTKNTNTGNTANRSNGGCLAFPFRIIGDLINSFSNPQTRKSSSILIGAILVSCCGLFGITSLLGSPSSQTPPKATPTHTQIVAISIAQTSSAAPSPTTTATLAPTETQAFIDVPLADYPRMAASRFKSLQGSFAEFVEIHKQFAADPAVNQNADWHSHALSVLGIVVASTNEIASMRNIPGEYAAFHQSMQPLASEIAALESNYMAALNNQDMNALSQANTNLINSITYLNQSSTLLQASNITPTPQPTKTSIPTATIYIPPVQPPSSHPAGTSGQCKDGTYTSAQHKQGACSHHGGVSIWWGP